MLESKGERDAVQWARARGWTVYKLGGQGEKGRADRLFLHMNCIIFMEFKRPKGGVVGALQKWHARQLLKIGYITYFPTSCEEAITILEQVYELNNASELAAETVSREGHKTHARPSGGGAIFGSGVGQD